MHKKSLGLHEDLWQSVNISENRLKPVRTSTNILKIMKEVNKHARVGPQQRCDTTEVGAKIHEFLRVINEKCWKQRGDVRIKRNSCRHEKPKNIRKAFENQRTSLEPGRNQAYVQKYIKRNGQVKTKDRLVKIGGGRVQRPQQDSEINQINEGKIP